MITLPNDEGSFTFILGKFVVSLAVLWASVSLWQAAVAFLRSAPPSFLMLPSEKVVGKGKGSGGINF